MASERQISANRRNALKSTGPKSRAGKKRAGRNSLRHGLSNISAPGECDAVESLARRIAGDVASDAVLRHARAAARAQLHLARIRALKTEIINRTFLFGALELRPRFRSFPQEIGYIKKQPFDRPLLWPPRIDPLGPMPTEEAERMDAALRRSLPQVRKLYRYERWAIRERDRALTEISGILKSRSDAASKKRSARPRRCGVASGTA
jgi:hypothetical protein